MEQWLRIGQPGYFGARRDAALAEYDRFYGIGNWRLAWKIGPLMVDRVAACALYEDAYFAFMTARPLIVAQLIEEASDVYDDAPTNVASRFDYAAQETNRTHVQDIAIRRVLLRIGLWFKGAAPIQIRHHNGPHELSRLLSPGNVPFHRPGLLEPPYVRSKRELWYAVGSVEDFYQRNKYLQAKVT
jgi:hypothetical protein